MNMAAPSSIRCGIKALHSGKTIEDPARYTTLHKQRPRFGMAQSRANLERDKAIATAYFWEVKHER